MTTSIPATGLIATRFMELRKRRGLMITGGVLTVGFPALFFLIRLLLHAFAPSTNQPAGGDDIFKVMAAGFLPSFGFFFAVMVGCTAGSRDLAEGMFRNLVVTGRSRLALYLARIPAGLAIVVSLVGVGYAIVCAACAFAAPTAIYYSNVNVPPGLSLAGFENFAANRARLVICDLPYTGPDPRGVTCSGPPIGSKSAVSPAQPAPAPAEALAARIAKDNYSGYASARLTPPDAVMIKAGLWIELEATVVFIIALGLASLMGQRGVPMILLIVLQMILTPILTAVNIPHLLNVQRSVVGVALARLEPSGLPVAFGGLPGVTGGVGGPGDTLASKLPESATEAVFVILAWLAAWTALGAWRMMTRDA